MSPCNKRSCFYTQPKLRYVIKYHIIINWWSDIWPHLYSNHSLPALNPAAYTLIRLCTRSDRPEPPRIIIFCAICPHRYQHISSQSKGWAFHRMLYLTWLTSNVQHILLQMFIIDKLLEAASLCMIMIAVTLRSDGCFLSLVLTLACVSAAPQRPCLGTQSRGRERDKRERERGPQVSQLQAQLNPKVNGLEESQS